MNVLCLKIGDSRWPAVEQQLDERAVPIPFGARSAWLSTQASSDATLMVVEEDGSPIAAALMSRDASRSLPGHRILRVLRFGHGVPERALAPLADAMLSAVTRDGRALRLNVGVFSRHRAHVIADLMQARGFHRAEDSGYRHTLTMDLAMSPEQLLAERSTLRKRLREAEKAQAQVLALTDPKVAPRLAELQRAAMQRSGGTFSIPDWPSVLRFSQAHPALSRVVGLYPAGSAGLPEELIGFAWGISHGDHVEYRAAGTDRVPGLKLSISHPLLWDLVLWARQHGATWFDLGGVTLAAEGDDPLAGISEFKRHFSTVVEEVGQEWSIAPHRFRAGLASFVSRTAGNLQRMKTKAGRS